MIVLLRIGLSLSREALPRLQFHYGNFKKIVLSELLNPIKAPANPPDRCLTFPSLNILSYLPCFLENNGLWRYCWNILRVRNRIVRIIKISLYFAEAFSKIGSELFQLVRGVQWKNWKPLHRQESCLQFLLRIIISESFNSWQFILQELLPAFRFKLI